MLQGLGTVTSERSSLERDGYTVVRNALDRSMLGRLAAHCDQALTVQAREHFNHFRFHGSMLPLDWRDELTTELVTAPATISSLRRAGFDRPRWLSGYIISKPAGSPALWWHQDWWGWGEPESLESTPPQLFVMYYLRDVQPVDGCLRVIPGSHRRRHPLHDDLPEAHSEELLDPEVAQRAQRPQPDEVSVPVRAGDAVVGDVRLLHSTHPNQSDKRRTCLTLWYLPEFDRLSERIRAYTVGHPFLPTAGWWRGEGGGRPPARLAPLLPTYDGSEAPADYRRTPPPEFV